MFYHNQVVRAAENRTEFRTGSAQIFPGVKYDAVKSKPPNM